jgi:hypothetical protein
MFSSGDGSPQPAAAPGQGRSTAIRYLAAEAERRNGKDQLKPVRRWTQDDGIDAKVRTTGCVELARVSPRFEGSRSATGCRAE